VKQKKSLRLILTSLCSRRCPGCCNEDRDIGGLPRCTDFTPYDEILITGGEPMEHLDLLYMCIHEIKVQAPETPIYVYTARTTEPYTLWALLSIVDGVTITLHEEKDVAPFKSFEGHMPTPFKEYPDEAKSLRLNIFKGVSTPKTQWQWKTKANIEWIKNCPLPEHETFMRW